MVRIGDWDLRKIGKPERVKIFVATRTPKAAWNPGGFQPAVSGDGQPEDLTTEGIYDPIHTAMREGLEECLGRYPVDREHVTFFGLAAPWERSFRFYSERFEFQ